MDLEIKFILIEDKGLKDLKKGHEGFDNRKVNKVL